jgi:chromosomal replication initiation ATPase DnaA
MAQVIAPSEWDTWIEPLDLLALDGGAAVVGAPNCFARDQLAATYGTLLEDALTAELGHPVAIEVVIAPAATGRRPA